MSYIQMANTVTILGTKYSIDEVSGTTEPRMEDSFGCCDYGSKEILLNNQYDNEEGNTKSYDKFKRTTLRHEITHAFCNEGGNFGNEMLNNEIVTDWVAHISPKLFIAFLKAGALDPDTLEEIGEIITNDYDDDFVFINQSSKKISN